MIFGIAAVAALAADAPPPTEESRQWAADQLVTGSAAEVTRTLLDLSAQYQLAPDDKRAEILATLLDVASNRQQLLAALIEDEPAEVPQPADL